MTSLDFKVGGLVRVTKENPNGGARFGAPGDILRIIEIRYATYYEHQLLVEFDNKEVRKSKRIGLGGFRIGISCVESILKEYDPNQQPYTEDDI